MSESHSKKCSLYSFTFSIPLNAIHDFVRSLLSTVQSCPFSWMEQTNKTKKEEKKTRTVRFPWRFWLNSFRHIFEYFFDFYFVSITLAVGTYFKWNYLCMCILMSLNTDFGCFFCVWASVESMLNAMSIGFRWNNFRRLRPFSETMFMTTEILSNHHIQSF